MSIILIPSQQKITLKFKVNKAELTTLPLMPNYKRFKMKIYSALLMRIIGFNKLLNSEI